MFQTYEAYYEDGKLTFLTQNQPIKKAKVLVTVIEEKEAEWPVFKKEDFLRFKNTIELSIDPLEFQKNIRDEW